MHTFITRLPALLLLFLPFSLMAQKTQDYNILLHSGKFTPAANLANLSKKSAVFEKSSFLDQHYLVIQFSQLPNEQEKDQLMNDGIQLIDYIPNNAFTAVLTANFHLEGLRKTPARSIFRLEGYHKTIPALYNGNFPTHAKKVPGTVDLTVTSYTKLNRSLVATTFNALDAIILQEFPVFRNFTIRIPTQNFHKLLDLPFLQWAEAVEAPNRRENLLGRSLHRVNMLNDGVRNLKGNGVNIGIWDGGEVQKHVDFSPVDARITLVETSAVTDHGTHCAGTLGAGGLVNPKARGMAPLSRIFSFDFNGNIPAEQAAAIPAQGLAVSSHSYGSGTPACGLNSTAVAYSTASRNTDLNLNNFPNHLHVHSAGNSQTDCSGGWSTITSAGKSAKNNILVADITTLEAISGSSSFGPVADGRVKPEISSLGTGVLSTVLNNGYATFSGTSMATPGVAGTAALLVERYRQLNGNTEPPSALLKNALLNTAYDLGNIGPDYRFGYGRLNALSAIRILEQNRYQVNNLSTGGSNDITITVPVGVARLSVMITWNDPAATPNSVPALVNNLDLSVINGSVTHLPWVLDPNNPSSPAITGVDNVSNIEQVVIAEPLAGVYTLHVAGTSIAVGPQKYSITWTIDQPSIEVIFPNGAESISPGSTETLTWDNAGLTGTQTLEYSVNNGVTWIPITSGLSSNITRWNWTPPAGTSTATARIRVSSGSIADESDANFNILGTPAGLNTVTACDGSLVFFWTAVPGSGRYDLLSLDENTGQFITQASNISTNTYTVSGLTPGASFWFTLVAKNPGSGAVSERAIAIKRMVPASGFNTIGSISGNASICGVNTNVSYSIPAIAGATSYTWTVPAGAFIAAGQGTATISVSFPAGSVSGNVTVVASSATCQTPAAILPVLVNSVPVDPPVSGGNQVQTVCNGTPLPTLTATATVPSNFSLIWYTAASGGIQVTNPTLNTVGSVTYYGASKNNSVNCESSTRTAVTLTIMPAPPGVIAANGSLTFCQGESVILTAPAGSTYGWSNGATTQAITASVAGNYSVTVIQSSGCLTTAAATVTVNALPTVSLSASPYTKLYPGLKTILTASAPGAVSYSWYRNGVLVPGATGASVPVTIDKRGDYSVLVVNGAGCSGTSSIVNIGDSASAELFIYPNPNRGQFSVTYYNSTATKNVISVYDNKGSRIMTKTFSNAPGYPLMPVDISNHGKGSYRITVGDANGRKIKTGTVLVL
jgi:hypothetical protein